MNIDAHYTNPRLAELYDLDSPWSVDREFYLSLAGPPCKRILDLGCGTGLLCDAYAGKGHEVTGADPSPAMLTMARQKPHGDKIEWVQSSAQHFSSNKRFDLIIMTGHAFQVLLEDADITQTISAMRNHLAPGGMIAFESRNPVIDWPSQWNYEVYLEANIGRVRESRRFITLDGNRMKFELRYDLPDESLVSSSELRFLSHTEIAERLATCGLRIDKLIGDWNWAPFEEAVSPEMIFLVREHSSINTAAQSSSNARFP